jgi:hypothetical protein
MKNHPSDFESPFGVVILAGNHRDVIASCNWCNWIKTTEHTERKHWSAASRARMGLQLHALAKHKTET